MMKKITLIIVALTALLVSGCEDFLDTRNLYQKDLTNFYKTPTDITEAMGGVYNALYVGGVFSEEHLSANLMADYMLAATLALNDFIRMGISQDWATHQIGHELTALHGTTHGHSLAIVMPGTLRVLKEQKHEKLLQYGERVFGITGGSEPERVDKAIEKTEEFYRSLGLTTRLSEENIGNETIETIAKRFNDRGVAFGENQNVTGDVAREILLACS